MLPLALHLLQVALLPRLLHGKTTITDAVYAALARDATAPAILTFPPLLPGTFPADAHKVTRFVLMVALKRHARASQHSTARILDGAGLEYTQYWIDNSLHATVNATTVGLLAGGDSGEAVMTVDGVLAGLQFVDSVSVRDPTTDGDLVPTKHLEQLNMHAAWRMLNHTAKDVTVATIDTGVQADHPELQSTFSGWWLDMQSDPANRQPKPHDPHGHGTHTMASMAGKSVGTAPGVRWMSARACTESGCLRSDLTAAAQFVMCPDAQCLHGAHVVSNSYGATEPAAMQWMGGIIRTWSVAGMAVVFAAGNSGPLCGTVYSPATNPAVLAVGAVNEHSRICSFSSRHGSLDPRHLDPLSSRNMDPLSSRNMDPASRNMDPASRNMVVAPGLKIVSAWPGGRYAEMSGTSMACPLVAGIVALLRAAGKKSVDVLEVLKETADSTVVVPDRCCDDGQCAYGHGLADAGKAVSRLLADL